MNFIINLTMHTFNISKSYINCNVRQPLKQTTTTAKKKSIHFQTTIILFQSDFFFFFLQLLLFLLVAQFHHPFIQYKNISALFSIRKKSFAELLPPDSDEFVMFFFSLSRSFRLVFALLCYSDNATVGRVTAWLLLFHDVSLHHLAIVLQPSHHRH